MIEEDLDAALERIARDEKTSKAALVRRLVTDRTPSTALLLPSVEEDELFEVDGLSAGSAAAGPAA